MPTYDYQCQACQHRLEAFHAMSAEPLKDCPACGKPKLKRQIGPGAGLLFKGTGFYQTDYRSDSYKKAAEKESGSKKESSASAESTAKSSASSASSASTSSDS
jgi:putative FmdB family regulatory protein